MKQLKSQKMIKLVTDTYISPGNRTNLIGKFDQLNQEQKDVLTAIHELGDKIRKGVNVRTIKVTGKNNIGVYRIIYWLAAEGFVTLFRGSKTVFLCDQTFDWLSGNSVDEQYFTHLEYAKEKVKRVKESNKTQSPGGGKNTNQKTIHRLTKENPRKKDTHGWRSWNLVEDGMTVEEYKKAGGRGNDLNWDINKGFVELK